MTKKEAIESIKAATKAIGLLFTSDEKKFEAVKVKDGSQDVSVEGEYTKGTKVSVSSSTGSISAPDGNYTLSNGKKFATKGGVISEVMDDDSDSDEDFSSESKEAETVEEVKAEDVKSDEVKSVEEVKSDEEVKSVEEVKPEAEDKAVEPSTEIIALTDKVKELEEAFKLIKEAFATKDDMKSLGEKFSLIKEAFEVLSDTPAEFSKVDISVLAKEDKAKRLEALAGLMGKK